MVNGNWQTNGKWNEFVGNCTKALTVRRYGYFRTFFLFYLSDSVSMSVPV